MQLERRKRAVKRSCRLDPARQANPEWVRLSAERGSDATQQEQLGPMRALLDGRTRESYDPAAVADWLDLGALGRAVDLRRRAGFFGLPRPVRRATSRRCWT